MADVQVNWVLPTTRISGFPLDPADIAHVEIHLSADGGNSYGKIGEYPPSVLSMTQTELDPGEWFFQGIVVDTKGKASKPLVNAIYIEDTSDPSALQELTLNL